MWVTPPPVLVAPWNPVAEAPAAETPNVNPEAEVPFADVPEDSLEILTPAVLLILVTVSLVVSDLEILNI